MKKRNLIYIAISVFCVIAIAAGVYYQIFGQDDKKPTNNHVSNTQTDGEQIDDPEEIKEEFNSLFTNMLYEQGYDLSSIQKIAGLENQDIVYAAYNIKEEKDGKYNVDINLPVFNIAGEKAAEFNANTQSIFANKANDILNNANQYTIYNVDYVAYMNDQILSLVIKSILKEGNSAQRIIVQTYNYDVVTGKEVSLNEVLEAQGYSIKEVNQKIEEQVEEANKQAEALSQAVSQTGQTVYKRDINNAMYVTDNVTNFFIGEGGTIYIVYAYGNSNFTSEMDIIKVS
ncbi:MAG: hypothetical protein ACLTEH_05075 [Clostridia bacterium]